MPKPPKLKPPDERFTGSEIERRLWKVEDVKGCAARGKDTESARLEKNVLLYTIQPTSPILDEGATVC